MNYAHLTCALAMGALALSAQTVTPTVTQTTGMVGIADAQTAQLNLLNPGVQPPALGPVCTVAVSFVNANGKVLKSTMLTVAPGQSQNFDLRSDVDLSLLPGDRREIRATITSPVLIPPPNAAASTPPVPLCKLIPTLEIFDTVTGRTLVTLGHVTTIPPAPVVTP